MATASEGRRSYEHLRTTSDKIRWLAAKGVARADIARELGIRYQHVRNVLVQDEVRAAKTAGASVSSGGASNEVSELKPTKVRLGPDGRVVVPAQFREAFGLKEGDTLFAVVENDEIHLLSPKAAMRRAQAIVREFVPAGVSLVDELIEDRRREVEREARDD